MTISSIPIAAVTDAAVSNTVTGDSLTSLATSSIATTIVTDGTPAVIRPLRQGVRGILRCVAKFAGVITQFRGDTGSQDNRRLKGSRKRTTHDENEENEPLWVDLLAEIIPRLIILGVTWYLTKGAGQVDPGFKVCDTNVATRFANIAGCDEAKAEIAEFVDILRRPEKYQELGATVPHGALLCGPPGTGKTLLAKAVAGEAGVPFFSVSGSSFVQLYVGVGPQRVRELFRAARAKAPCIIFIDEFESIGRARGDGALTGGSTEYHNTLNQLLVEMDGFESSGNVVVFAATNKANDLDSAVTRAGRLDRKIELDIPDVKARRELFTIYLKNDTIDGDVAHFADRLAELTPGMVGADIANICNEAAITAVRRNLTKIDLSSFEAAIDRVVGGMSVSKVISKEEKRVIAYHEAGHAIAGLYLKHADPVVKVTIIPRSGGTMGFTQIMPPETYLRTREQLLDRVCVLLAGRAAEQMMFDEYSSGASNDLEVATRIAYNMVKDLGMSEKIGQVSYGHMDLTRRFYSDSTGEMMDQEVRLILEEAYQRALDLMEKRSEELKQLADLLLEKETINKDDIEILFPAKKRKIPRKKVSVL